MNGMCEPGVKSLQAVAQSRFFNGILIEKSILCSFLQLDALNVIH
jgi:hypothetical protein